MERAGRVRLNILGVREDDKWCAIALEMSLRGYGETFEEALDDLEETIIVQVTYAIKHHSSIDHILIPAESHYFEIFAIAKREALKQSFSKTRPISTSRVSDGKHASSSDKNLSVPSAGTSSCKCVRHRPIKTLSMP